jgi:hypothetical protein
VRTECNKGAEKLADDLAESKDSVDTSCHEEVILPC